MSARVPCHVRFHKLPQVRCALWQAKHARRAFFLRGREGSLGLLFGGGLVSGPLRAGLISSVEARSIFSSAMMLELSRSTPGPGEGEPSSASGDILKAGYECMAERATRCTSTECDAQTAWRAAHGQGMCSHLQRDVSIWETRGPGIEAVEPAMWSGAGSVIVGYCTLPPPPYRRGKVTRSVAQLVTAVQRGPRTSTGAGEYSGRQCL